MEDSRHYSSLIIGKLPAESHRLDFADGTFQ